MPSTIIKHNILTIIISIRSTISQLKAYHKAIGDVRKSIQL